jgi:pumilio homology domain family member 6
LYPHVNADKTEAIRTLLGSVAQPYSGDVGSVSHPIDLPHTSRMHKTLLQGGHFSRETGSVERSAHWTPVVYAEMWVKIVGRGVTLAAAKNGGTFVIAELVERVTQDGSDDTKEELRSWFLADKKDIKLWDAKGSQILLEKVESL